jgi:hypothetical protein
LISNPGKNKNLKQEIDNLYYELGVKTGTALDLTHIPLIEKVLDIRIKIVPLQDKMNFV